MKRYLVALFLCTVAALLATDLVEHSARLSARFTETCRRSDELAEAWNRYAIAQRQGLLPYGEAVSVDRAYARYIEAERAFEKEMEALTHSGEWPNNR